MENQSPFKQEESNFTRRVGELRAALEKCDPRTLAKRSGAEFEPRDDQTGVFHLALWDRPIALRFPELVVMDEEHEPATLVIQALVLYYFQTAHGPAPTGEWVSFSELPDGKFYNQAFQGYSGKQISRAFGNDTSKVQQAALAAGGELLPAEQSAIGDFACRFRVLPRLPVLLVGWQGDEDFPASYHFLFDSSATNYLPIDVCAIVGGMLARKVIAQVARDADL